MAPPAPESHATAADATWAGWWRVGLARPRGAGTRRWTQQASRGARTLERSQARGGPSLEPALGMPLGPPRDRRCRPPLTRYLLDLPGARHPGGKPLTPTKHWARWGRDGPPKSDSGGNPATGLPDLAGTGHETDLTGLNRRDCPLRLPAKPTGEGPKPAGLPHTCR